MRIQEDVRGPRVPPDTPQPQRPLTTLSAHHVAVPSAEFANLLLRPSTIQPLEKALTPERSIRRLKLQTEQLESSNSFSEMPIAAGPPGRSSPPIRDCQVRCPSG